MLRRRIPPCCCALAASLALAAPAAAQNDAPQVDPGSPAGTEYQLPIDRARKQAGGGGSNGSSGGAEGEAPLFGAGVEGTSSDSATTKPRSGSAAGTPTTTIPGEQPALGTSSPETVRAQASAPDGGGSGLVAIGAGGAGVLLIGGLAGLAWRRRTMRR